MFYAKRIKMKTGSRNADCLTEIDSIYLTGCKQPGYYKKEILHDYLKDHPGSIKVDAYPTYPSLIPAVSVNYEKYVKSTPNGYGRDNLLSLPRD